MILIEIPDFGSLEIEHLVLDFNGTLACDGQLLPGVAKRMAKLAPAVDIHVLTADTFGTVQAQLKGIPCKIEVLPKDAGAEAKRDYVQQLGAEQTACIGNGRNDRLMLETAALGVAVLLGEGAAPAALSAADVVCADIRDAFDLLRKPLRLVATLRS